MKKRSFVAYTGSMVAVAAGFMSKAWGNTQVEKLQFAKFLKAFPPDEVLKPFTGKISRKLEDHAHPLLISFWKTVGFGSFDDGFIHFFHPDEYAKTLGRWLMSDTSIPSRIPFARTAFGDLIYFRDLRSKAKSLRLSKPSDLAESSDVYFLSVHYRKGELISYTVEDFFDSDLESFLKSTDFSLKDKYKELRKNKPPTVAESCYYFQPALVFGGRPDIKFTAAGNCLVHLDILYQLGI
jgi:hypothetical protein